MTTTMESHTDLHNPTQMPPQQQAQAQSNPPPAAPENTGNRYPSPDNNAVQKKQRNQELCALSKTFGHIPNVPIFSEWKNRQDCCDTAVHRSIMAGICGNSKDGAYSVGLSSLYKDDEDGGDVIIYTGTGGRKKWSDTFPPKRVKLGPQTEDQTWDHPQNKALIVSYLTGNPVRVVRSWKCPSQYAPLEGQRYDGLYRVAAYWTAKGQNGKKICRCRLERLPNQPPIPLRPITFSTHKKRGRKRLVSRLSCSPSPSIDNYDMDETYSCTVPNHPDPSAMQLSENTGGEPVGLSNPPYQQEIPETSSGIDSTMGEVDVDVKEEASPLPAQRRAEPQLSALPRYRWDPKTNNLTLVKFPAPGPTPAEVDAAEEDAEDHRGEDDATLVPSEDGHFDMPANERMETEYFSGRGTPQPGTPAELHVSGCSVLEEQGDH